jgi:hypothetical protein
VRDFFWAAAVAPSVALRFRAISTPPMVALSRVAACGVEVSQWLRPHINFQRPTVTFALVIPVRPNSGLWLPLFDKSSTTTTTPTAPTPCAKLILTHPYSLINTPKSRSHV